MRRVWSGTLLAAVLTVMVGCGSGEGPSEEPTGGIAVDLPEMPRNMGLDSVMAEVVDQSAHGLWDLGRAGMAPPESEMAWDDVERYAIQLIASGNYITYGSAIETDANWVERTGWKAYSQDLADAGVIALDAAIRRDADGVLAAGDKLATVCESCHTEYRLAPPTADTGPDR